jgi:hypothetical protein
MSNVLGDTTRHQILALGRLGWTLWRIQQTTGVRRETISGYLKAAGIPVRGRGRPSESRAKPAISRPLVSTDPGPAKPAISAEVSTDSDGAKPATRAEVPTDSAPVPHPGRAPSASACEPYRELIADALRRGRNAMAIWQDLVDDHGFTARYASVRCFVMTLRGASTPEARVVITTAPGEEGQVDYGDGPMVRHPQTGKYRRTRLRRKPRLLPQSGAAVGVAVEHAGLGRAPRPRISFGSAALGEAARRHRSGHRTARSLTASRTCAEVRTSELADESAGGFRHRRRNEVELTGLGQPGEIAVLPCP